MPTSSLAKLYELRDLVRSRLSSRVRLPPRNLLKVEVIDSTEKLYIFKVWWHDGTIDQLDFEVASIRCDGVILYEGMEAAIRETEALSVDALYRAVDRALICLDLWDSVNWPTRSERVLRGGIV